MVRSLPLFGNSVTIFNLWITECFLGFFRSDIEILYPTPFLENDWLAPLVQYRVRSVLKKLADDGSRVAFSDGRSPNLYPIVVMNVLTIPS